MADTSTCKRTRSRTASYIIIALRAARFLKWNVAPLVVRDLGRSSRSVVRTARRTPLKVQVVSSSRRIGGFCSRPMAATIRSPASVSAQLDVKPTGNPVEGKSGTAKSLAYAPSSGTLIVLHSFGPDHVRLMSVHAEGKLSARPERYTVNTHDKPNRVPTMVVISPDEKFVFVGTTFDEPIVSTGLYPDGSPILWVQRAGGAFHSIASNLPDPDGIAVFPLREDGSLGTARFYDAGGASPFYIAFLHGRPDTFVIGYAVGDGCSMGTIDKDGKVNIGPLVKIDTSAGVPSELCWLAVSPDDRTVYATNFGYSYISSYHINGRGLEIACDPACTKVPGDGTARGLNGTVISGPADNWLTPDGAYLYQIYGNAAKLVGYATQRDGSLEEVASVKIPYNSPQGLAGF